MSKCVNLSSREFRDCCKRLNVSAASLEPIIHEYINIQGNEFSFPSDVYINNKLNGRSIAVLADEQIQLWEKRYSQPKQFDNSSDALTYFNEVNKFFPKEAIGIKQTLDNKYEVRVAEPFKSDKLEDNNTYHNKTLSTKTSVLDILASKHPYTWYGSKRGQQGDPLLKKIGNTYFLSYNKPKDKKTPPALSKETALEGLTSELRKLGLDPDYIGVTDTGVVYERTEKYSIEDRIEAYKESEDLFESKEQQEQALSVLDFLSEKTGLRYKFISEEEAKKLLKRELNPNENAFVGGNTAYFIKGRRFNTDIASEEMLHPFVNSILLSNKEAFNSLLEDARKSFPKLAIQIEEAYKNRNETERQEELVTQALSRAFRKDFEENPNHNSIKDLIRKFFEAIAGWFRNNKDLPWFNKNGNIIDKIYAQDLSETINLENLAKIINTEIQLGNANFIKSGRFNVTSESKEIFYFEEDAYDYMNDLIEDGVDKNDISIKYIPETEENDYYWMVTVKRPSTEPRSQETSISQEDLEEREENIKFLQEEANMSREEAEKMVDTYADNSTTEEGSEKSKTKDARKEALNNTHQEQLRINEQINNITKSGIINKAEVTELAYDIVYTMSDYLTKWQDNPKSIIEDLSKHDINFNPKDVARVKNLSRGELVHLIGAGNVLNFIKEECFGEEYDDGTLSEEEYDLLEDKKLLLYENFEALMQFGISAFATIEDFSLSFSEAGYIVSEHDEDNNSSDQSNEEIHAAEENGDKQEHWQVDSKTIDNILSMSQIVKRELVRLYDTHEVTVDGETVVEPKKNLYGMNKRIDPRNATYSILRWTEGALTLPKMIERLQAKAKDNIWLNSLLEKLTDTSGRYSDFQSQFFTTFCKHFQDYYIVKESKQKDGSKVKIIMPVNRNPVLRQTIKDIETLYNIQSHPLFTSKGLKADAYDKLKRAYEKLVNLNKQPFDSLNKEQLIKGIQFVSKQLGYVVSKEDIEAVLNEQVFNSLLKELQPIVNNLGKGLNNSAYNPFGDFKDGGIKGNLRNFLKPLVENKEAINADSVYDSGKMYQSRIIPSWLSKTMDKFLTLEGKEYQDFLEEEYGNYEWFRDTSVPISNKASWINPWLRRLANLGLEDRKKLFGHHVQLNYLGHNYMRNMSEPEYILSVLTAFNSGEKDVTKIQTAWYKIPMMSNKPSLEFIKFERYSQDRIATELLNIFAQEVKRIKTVTARGYKKGDPQFIKNFDGKRGKSFVFLDYLNDYLPGGKSANTELGKRLKAKLEGDKIESWTDKDGRIYNDENALIEIVKRKIIDFMTKKTESIIESYKSNGVYEVCKTITGVGTTDTAVNDFLTSFVWNDTFAAINILELTIGDMAYYANAEDVQKRLAQIHAPGLKGNMFALDYGEYDANGKVIREAQQVCDGNLRTIFLKDFEKFKQNIIENLEIVFDKKIAQAEGVAKEYWTNLKKNIIHQFKTQINVADAQAYNCPTSYRKKALMFGKWSQRSEEIYQKLIKGEANISDIETAFQPLKPFVYTNVHKHSNTGEMTNLKVGMQFKNSEYLLIMADALLRGEDTGKPNMLRALFDVMEDSVKYTTTTDENGNVVKTPKSDRTKGIDSFQFESAVKAGLQGAIDLTEFIEKGGDARGYIESLIYDKDGNYIEDRVHIFPAEDYSIQQEVPKHFMEHSQAHGSQERMIIPSDLALKDDEGNDVIFTYTHPDGTVEEWKASEFRNAYEHNIAKGIEESIKALEEELGLNFTGPDAKKLRNIALSQILQKEILSSPRYGIDLYLACGVNSKDEFNIPLGDPIQSKRVEQLINSIIKNRVNKQKIAGGPVVQVSNFGMSERLNIKFLNKEDGGILESFEEWSKKNPNKTKEDYTKKQGGIAYYECYAPAYMKELLTDFMDENGDIDIEAIEATNPEMLEMIGYRIPTEDAYSIAPLKIKGFLPKEAGEGIVMPYEIVLITGSDFDKLIVEIKPL